MGKGKFWFGGHRTIEQQMTGLDQLWPRVKGKTVLDLGCAEGAIALRCWQHGAKEVLGLEHRKDAVDEFNRQAAKMGATAIGVEVDLNTWHPARFGVNGAPFADVILMLAILHKLRKPADQLMRFLASASPTATVVLRTRRRDWPVLRDERSAWVPQDIRFCMYDHGFNLVHEDDGPVDNGEPPEWVGIFERVRA
jgi:2-polyprenyl-3-methyl-5-hydroxy-6-metoxy-1,4-benzoquinol methylase